MNALNKFLADQKIGLIDIGARGGIEPEWRKIQNNIKAFLFEPDERSRNELKSIGYVEKIFPVALGSSEGIANINLCKSPGTSSLLKPRYEFLKIFFDVSRFDIISEEEIELSTLDKCLLDRWEDCDFIKLDTQGTELDILKGGKELINKPLIGFEIEVEFVQMYKDQPLFGDVCSFLDKNQYQFYDLIHLCRWERTKFTLFGQAIFGDGLFLRSPESFSQILESLPADLARNKAVKYIGIVALYDHIDLIPICKELFSKYFTITDIKGVENLYKQCLRRRIVSSFIIRVANRLLKYLGIKVTGFQKS